MPYVFFFILLAGVTGVIVWSQKNQAPEPIPSKVEMNLPENTSTSNVESSNTINSVNTKTINGMKIETTQQGTGAEIKNGQTAVMQYSGSLTNGTVFDASARHGQDFKFPLGAGMVIKGWDQGVLGMKVGEVRKLTIPPELGYGATGAGSAIPPNATLIFEVKLVAIE